MSETNAALADKAVSRHWAINLPQPMCLILFALAIGLAGGLAAPALIKSFAAGYGRSLGDFALILMPSFILAACLSRQALGGAPRVASALAPVTAAGMVCPDTSYAALAAVAQERKLSVAFGSYAGYRLLFPAGPLIVATGLGIDSSGLFFLGLVLLIPVWLAGEIWVRFRAAPVAGGSLPTTRAGSRWSGDMAQALAPLAMLCSLLLAGGFFNLDAIPVLDFLTRPKGALLVAAAMAIAATAPAQQRECLDEAMAKSASLLLVIGAASAFGSLLNQALPVQRLIPDAATGAGMLAVLFLVTMVIKMVHGSSTVTLAVAVAVFAPLIHGAGVPAAAAVFAICLGSFVILPTDSFYWLVRSDALRESREGAAITTLAAGATLQGAVGFLALLLMYRLGLA